MKKKEEKTKKRAAKKEEARTYRCHCPFCSFMESLTHERRRQSEFWEHMDKAQVELLEAFRSLLDHKIQRIKEKKQESSEGLTKIEIDE